MPHIPIRSGQEDGLLESSTRSEAGVSTESQDAAAEGERRQAEERKMDEADSFQIFDPGEINWASHEEPPHRDVPHEVPRMMVHPTPAADAPPSEHSSLLQRLHGEVRELAAAQEKAGQTLDNVQDDIRRLLSLVSRLVTADTEGGKSSFASGGARAERLSSVDACRPSAFDYSRPSVRHSIRAIMSDGVSVENWPLYVKIRRGLDSESGDVPWDKIMKLINREPKRKLSDERYHIKERFKPSIVKRRFRCHVGLLEVQDPNSGLIVTLELLGCIVLTYDLIITPYVLAWDIKVSALLYVFSLFVAFFWSLMLCIGFRVGFYVKGELKMNPRETAVHYLRNRFPLDAMLVVADWASLLLQSYDTSLLRLSKASRLLKVLRLVQVTELAHKVFARGFPESTRLALQLFKVMLGTTFFTHIMACGWYAAGHMDLEETGRRWPMQAEEDIGEIESPTYMYLTSFHWTLAQITLGSMEVSPSNSFERTFCIGLLMFGLMFSSTVVSLISSQAMEYVMLQRKTTQTMGTLRRFLVQSMVDASLATRVQRQVIERLAANTIPLCEQDVPALKLLPATLRTELLHETRIPNLRSHALFRMWCDIDFSALMSLCDDAVKFVAMAPQECVFVSGGPSHEAIFVVMGKLLYTVDPDFTPGIVEAPQTVVEHAWLCEAALWSSWTHVGKLEVDTSCQLMTISSAGLIQVLPKHPLVANLTRHYGRMFHLRIPAAVPPHAPWPNDVVVPFTEPSDLLSQEVGIGLLHGGRTKGKLSDMNEQEFQELEAELKSEKCALMESSDGDMQRIVSVIAVSLRRPSTGRLLIEVGAWTPEHGAKHRCVLPGMKRSRGQLPHRALETLLERDLSAFSDGIELERCECTVEVKESASYGGLKTKYLRTVHHAKLSKHFEEPHLPWTNVSEPQMMERETDMSTTMGVDKHLSRDTVGFMYEDAIRQQNIFAHSNGGKVLLFAWLLPTEFEYLRDTPQGKAFLRNWIDGLCVEDFQGSTSV